MAQFEPGIVLQATANQPQFDPIRNYLVMAQLRAAKQHELMNGIGIQNALQEQQQNTDVRNAYRSAATPPQTGNYQQPGLDLGGNQIPAQNMQVSTPGGIDQNALRASLMRTQPQLIPGMDAQQAQIQQAHQQQQIATQESLLKLSAAQRAEASAQLEQSTKGLYSVMSFPEALRPQAYQQELQRQVQAGIIHPQQVGTEIPAQYPGPEGISNILTRSASVGEILKRIQEQKNEVPLSPEEAASLGKKPGDKVPLASKNTASEIVNRGHTTLNTEQGVYDYNRMTGAKVRLGDNPRNVFAPENKIMPVVDPNNPQNVIPMKAGAAMKAGVSLPQSIPYQTEKAMGKYMTSGKGGQQLTAFNTAMLHLDTLDKLADDLGNTDIRIVNKAKQAWAAQTGSPAPANFAAAVNAMSGEVAAALKASGATDQEIEKASSTFDRAQSPAQLKGAINTYRTLLSGKAQNLKGQNDAGMQGKPNFQGAQGTRPPLSSFEK